MKYKITHHFGETKIRSIFRFSPTSFMSLGVKGLEIYK